MKKNIINISISVIITLLLMRAVAGIRTSGNVMTYLSSANITFIIIAAVCYVCTYPIRAYRIYRITRNCGDVTYSRILPICFRHQFYGRIIPFKAGELSLVYMLKKNFGVPMPEGGAALIVLRFFDAIAIVLSFLICNFFVGINGIAGAVSLAGFIALVIFAAAMPYIFPKVILFLKKRDDKPFLEKIAKTAEDIWETIIKMPRRELASMLIYTALLWSFVYLSMHFVAAAFLPNLTIVQTVAASFLASLAAFLPINGIGGFGTTEAGWTMGFMLVGMDKSTALTSGLVSNVMSFVIVCIFGLISFAGRRRSFVRDNNNRQ